MGASTKAELSVVVWDDAYSDALASLTIQDAHLSHRPTVMQTIGWLLVSDDAGISIFNERCLDVGEETYRGKTFIPRSLVRSVTPFKLSTPRARKPAKEPPS